MQIKSHDSHQKHNNAFCLYIALLIKGSAFLFPKYNISKIMRFSIHKTKENRQKICQKKLFIS